MKITPPFTLTPRSLPGIQVDGVWLSVDYSCEQPSGHTRYVFYIDYNGKEFSTTGTAPNGRGLQKGLETLLNYLGDFEIATRYYNATRTKSEGYGLFPEALGRWSIENGMKIYELECQLIEKVFIEE